MVFDCLSAGSADDVEGDVHHLGEGGLPLFGGGGFAGEYVVGDGADAQGFAARVGGVHVELGYLHLDGEDAHALPAVVVGVGGVEGVGREYVADAVAVAAAFAGFDSAARQLEVGDGGEGAGQLVLRGVVGVGAGTGGDDEVAHVEVLLDGAGGAHADDGLHVVEVVQLVGVDAYRGAAHAVAHDADAAAAQHAGVAQHAAHLVEEHGVLQVVLGHEFHAQRIARHNDGLGNLAAPCANVWGGGICHNDDKFIR